MKMIITFTLFSLAAMLPTRAQWIVYDPSVHTQTILNGVQEIAKFVQVINNEIQQINTLTDQLNEFKHYESLFGDPKAVVVATVAPLVKDLRRSELGASMDAIMKAADGAEALAYSADGLYHSVGETFKTPKGTTVTRSPEHYRQFAAINDATGNYQTVSTNSAVRRVELKAQIAATVEALKSATTDAEVQKLSAVLTGLSADLHSTDQETGEALATAMVQDIENRNDERKQARALKEHQSAVFSEAVLNYGKAFKLLDAPTTFPK
ncbi:MAG: hypothetical protein L0Z50_37700 [Verrucomicrobiales bacterium]|nr:hypothetical protein [Verrucomicrobiales bacterium]